MNVEGGQNPSGARFGLVRMSPRAADGDILGGVGAYLMVFFAIWWA